MSETRSVSEKLHFIVIQNSGRRAGSRSPLVLTLLNSLELYVKSYHFFVNNPTLFIKGVTSDRLCHLVVRVPDCRTRGMGSSPGATRFSEKWWVWNGVH
jgi:hypothetical protein